MMSEKRFVIGDENTVMLLKRVIIMSDGRFEVDVDHLLRVWDTESNKRLTVEEVCDLLNEQQAEIEDLKDDKNQLHKVISKLRQEVAELKTRNVVLSSNLNQIPTSIKERYLE